MAIGRNALITEIETSGSGAIPEGAQTIGIINVGTADGFCSAVDGEGRIPAGTSKTFPQNSYTYPVMYYRAAGTTLLITVVK